MAPPPAKQLAVRLPENEAVARHLLEKRRSMAEEQQGGLSENLDATLSTAYRNICAAKEPIRTLKDLSQIKGVGKWLLRLMKGFFPESNPDLSPSKNDAAKEKGKKTRGAKRYVPQKNSVAYAILITLYREMINGKSFMKKQELIDATEASGLSQSAIGSDKSKAKPGSFGSSPRDWYTGWNCMKTLISKGLVVKSSNPAKYMLTEEGKETACDCLSRSGLGDPAGPSTTISAPSTSIARHDFAHVCVGSETSLGPLMAINGPSTSVARHCSELVCRAAVTVTSLEPMDLTTQKQLNYSSEVLHANIHAGEIILCDSDSEELFKGNSSPKLSAFSALGSEELPEGDSPLKLKACSSLETTQGTFELQSSSTMDSAGFNMLGKDAVDMDQNILAMPPHQSSEKFHEAYEVMLILDDRENFGSRSKRVVDNICSRFHIPVEVRRLPVGDGIWIARHRQLCKEYVLDFIVERKNVVDLCSSIRDNRYRDQKLRLQRCGLRKLIYLVEGDPNPLDASESIKTACLTTEILEGFDVQRTSGYADTERKYGHLTRSIIQYYSTHFCVGTRNSRVCPTYEEFVRKCHDLERMTVSDVFALQLMQVPQVTEEAALAVIELFPTVFSLAKAYSVLDGDTRAQEEMLKNKSKMVNAGASRNIFKLVWADG